ncbi:MAG: hypothetical protein ABGZ17_21995 [Planctomycetaceae bacterium]
MGRALAIWCVRGSVACYLGYVACDLTGLQTRWSVRWRRCLWSLGAVLLLVHILLAFTYFHDGSHARAVRETARQTAHVTGVSWGGGVYLNEAFVIYWLLDASLMWVPGRQRHGTQPRPMTGERLADRSLRKDQSSTARFWYLLRHGVSAFMMFNATVVFGPPFWRWLFPVAVLAILLVRWNTAATQVR